jgi:hypothetical protein
MARVITFSRTFPSYHPKAGQPTYFVEKFLASLDDIGLSWTSCLDVSKILDSKYYTNIGSNNGKHHTIRAGHRFKVGDKFSPRVWSGKPYNSKQIIIAPDVEIKKVWNIKINEQFFLKGDDGSLFVPDFVCVNDGLSYHDFEDWFTKSPEFKKTKHFDGQIICWNEKINY